MKLNKKDLQKIYDILTLVERMDQNIKSDVNNSTKMDKHCSYYKEIKAIIQPIINSHNPL